MNEVTIPDEVLERCAAKSLFPWSNEDERREMWSIVQGEDRQYHFHKARLVVEEYNRWLASVLPIAFQNLSKSKGTTT